MSIRNIKFVSVAALMLASMSENVTASDRDFEREQRENNARPLTVAEKLAAMRGSVAPSPSITQPVHIQPQDGLSVSERLAQMRLPKPVPVPSPVINQQNNYGNQNNFGLNYNEHLNQMQMQQQQIQNNFVVNNHFHAPQPSNFDFGNDASAALQILYNTIDDEGLLEGNIAIADVFDFIQRANNPNFDYGRARRNLAILQQDLRGVNGNAAARAEHVLSKIRSLFENLSYINHNSAAYKNNLEALSVLFSNNLANHNSPWYITFAQNIVDIHGNLYRELTGATAQPEVKAANETATTTQSARTSSPIERWVIPEVTNGEVFALGEFMQNLNRGYYGKKYNASDKMAIIEKFAEHQHITKKRATVIYAATIDLSLDDLDAKIYGEKQMVEIKAPRIIEEKEEKKERKVVVKAKRQGGVTIADQMNLLEAIEKAAILNGSELPVHDDITFDLDDKTMETVINTYTKSFTHDVFPGYKYLDLTLDEVTAVKAFAKEVYENHYAAKGQETIDIGEAMKDALADNNINMNDPLAKPKAIEKYVEDYFKSVFPNKTLVQLTPAERKYIEARAAIAFEEVFMF